MLIDILTDASKSLIKYGLDRYIKKKEFETLAKCLRDRTKREIRFNLEVVSELMRSNEDLDQELKFKWIDEDRIKLFDCLKMDTFRAIEESLLPFDEVFKGVCDINKKLLEYTVKSGHTGTRLSKCDTISNLVERTYHRIEFTKLYCKSANRNPDLAYLQDMMLLILKCI